MAAAFCICMVCPTGYIHGQVFQEIALLLHFSFQTLGIESKITKNQLDSQCRNIILGYHLLPSAALLKKYGVIVYQLEQLNDTIFFEYLDKPNQEKRSQILSAAAEIWDYSTDNITWLSSQGLKSKFLPLGFHPQLDKIPDAVNPDLDILFYGSIMPRRTKILDQLANEFHYTTKHLFGVYGPKRDQWISRSKIVLNIHLYPTQIFEAPRVSYLLNNRRFIITEISPTPYYSQIDMVEKEYQDLVQACVFYLQHQTLRGEIAKKNYSAFKSSYPMVQFLKSVI